MLVGPSGVSTDGSSQDSSSGSTLSPGDIATAVVLPGQSRITIKGTLNYNTPYRVFEIPTDPRTPELGIRLTTPAGDLPVTEQLAVFDAAGQKIATSSPGPDPHELSMNLPMARLGLSAGLFLKIAAPSDFSGSSSASTASDNFVLQVTREGDTSSSLAPVATTPAPSNPLPQNVASAPQTTTEPTLVSLVTERLASLSPSAEPDLVTLVPTPVAAATGAGVSSLASASGVATGPLPERGAAALGGVLADGDPVPQLDRHDAALVDLAQIGLPQPAVLPGAGDANLEAILADLEIVPEDAEMLMPRRSPDRFPQADSMVSDASPPNFDTLLAVLPVVAPSEGPAPTVKLATLGSPSKHEVESSSRPRLVRPASVVSGLTVAVSLLFSMGLPELSGLLTFTGKRRFQLQLRRRLRRTRAIKTRSRS